MLRRDNYRVLIRVYECPFATLTNDHKLGGLKQHKFILQFWRPEVQNGFHQVKVG